MGRRAMLNLRGRKRQAWLLVGPSPSSDGSSYPCFSAMRYLDVPGAFASWVRPRVIDIRHAALANPFLEQVYDL